MYNEVCSQSSISVFHQNENRRGYTRVERAKEEDTIAISSHSCSFFSFSSLRMTTHARRVAMANVQASNSATDAMLEERMSRKRVRRVFGGRPMAVGSAVIDVIRL